MSLSRGLRFRKFDLHVHTPASDCFLDKAVTPQAIVQSAINAGLSGIAITDHNTGAWVDKIKDAAKATPLIVFPGMEVLVGAGQHGIHVLAILDTTKTSTDVDKLCGELKIKVVNGQFMSELGTYQVIEIITNNIHQGIAILAHCTGPKGALAEMAGVQLTNIFQHPRLLAVETTPEDFADAEKRANKTRVIDLLDGTDQRFCCRRLAVIQSSDNPAAGHPGKHGIEGIGSRYTYLKVDDTVTLESLRLCFVDRDTRIRQVSEFKENTYPILKQITVKSGFLDKIDVELHDGLNCVLGAKGAGKSLLVEFLRFALDQPPTQRAILADHQEKLEERLKRYGEISVVVVDETGKDHTFTRVYNPAGGNPYKAARPEDVARFFPVLFLSQNEIIRIAEDETEQLKFIDRFFDFRSYQAKIDDLEKETHQTDAEFAASIRAVHDNREHKKQLGFLEEELKKINEQLKNPVFDEFTRADNLNKSLTRQRQFLTGLTTKLQTFRQRELEMAALPVSDYPLDQAPALKRMQDLCTLQKTSAIEGLKQLEADLTTAVATFDDEYRAWKPQYENVVTRYNDVVGQEKGGYKALEQRRLKVSAERETLTNKLAQSQLLVDRIKDIKTARDARLRQLADTYKEYLRERLLKCKKFERDSGGKLSIAIKESTNVDEFKTRLLALKKGTYLSDDDIQKVCTSISPESFIYEILRYNINTNRAFLNAIVKATQLALDKVQRLADHLLAGNPYEQLLELQYKARPQDRPEIRYKIPNGKYELLKHLSIGQKCTAMLIMALSDGTMPIAIDQPEDSLDIRSIWEDMCQKIRSGKERRQFVFTTHNASLAVASDTDKYLVLEADAAAGHVVFAGAIDTEAVREQVIKYLEGGIPTYKSKYLKYNIEKEKLYS